VNWQEASETRCEVKAFIDDGFEVSVNHLQREAAPKKGYCTNAGEMSERWPR